MEKEIVKYENQLNYVSLRKFNAVELDFLMLLCHKFKNQGLKTLSISLSDIRYLTNYKFTGEERFLNDLKAMNKKLLNCNFCFEDSKKIVQFVLFTTFEIDKENNILEVRLNEKYAFLLNNIDKNFTRFELDEFINLKSSYSKECYRRLKQFKSTGYWIVNIDVFREIFDIPESYIMKNINQRVLEPILRELSPIFKNLQIRKIRKRGRGCQVRAIEFSFQPEKIFSSSSKTSNTEKPSVFKPKSSTTTTNSTFNKFHNFDTPQSEKYSEEYLNALLKNPNKK